MKKFILAFLVAGFGFITSSYAQTTVEIVNNTSVSIYSVFASSANHPEWGSDLLGVETLSPGQKVVITFPAGYDCSVDIKASADANDEDSITFDAVDICEVAGISLEGNGKFSVY
jgi:hypothetical protein